MKSKLANWIVIAIIIFLIISSLKATFDLYQVQESVKNKEKEAQNLKREVKKIKDDLERVQTSDYIERVARDKLNLSKPGETVVILSKPLLSTQSAEVKDSRTNWEKWRALIF
jgi:cell division protein DivIC